MLVSDWRSGVQGISRHPERQAGPAACYNTLGVGIPLSSSDGANLPGDQTQDAAFGMISWAISAKFISLWAIVLMLRS